MEEVLEKYVGRLAPSPTGALHVGNVRTSLIAYLRARSCGGRVVLRIEDLDHPRDKKGAEKEIIDELSALGFEWDEFYRQSERMAFYKEALERLLAQDLVYPCICTRRDVEMAQSAPHEGDQLHYPGICRGRFDSWREAAFLKDRPCWRFKVPAESEVSFHDVFCGPQTFDVAKKFGDFPLARDEFGAGYTLAVVVDDAAMGITEVIRADDLLAATATQILLYRALNLRIPAFCHVPLVIGPDGKRLAKRHGDSRLAYYRAQGFTSEQILGSIAFTCGWLEKPQPISMAELLEVFSLSRIPREPYVWSDAMMVKH